MREADLDTHPGGASALTSPAVVPLVAAVLRLGAGALTLAGSRPAAIAVAALAVAWSVPGRPILRTRTLERVPGFARTTRYVSGRLPGTDAMAPGLLVVARLDTAPAVGPLRARHAWGAFASSLLAGVAAPLPAAALGLIVCIEALGTLAVIIGREVYPGAPAASAAGIDVLVDLAFRLRGQRPARDVWLVAAGGGTVGAAGLHSFLRSEPGVGRSHWTIALDDLSRRHPVVAPERTNFPRRESNPAVVRAVAQAAIETGDAIDVSRAASTSAEARLALTRSRASLTIVSSGEGRGATTRTAEILEQLARTVL